MVRPSPDGCYPAHRAKEGDRNSDKKMGCMTERRVSRGTELEETNCLARRILRIIEELWED